MKKMNDLIEEKIHNLHWKTCAVEIDRSIPFKLKHEVLNHFNVFYTRLIDKVNDDCYID